MRETWMAAVAWAGSVYTHRLGTGAFSALRPVQVQAMDSRPEALSLPWKVGVSSDH